MQYNLNKAYSKFECRIKVTESASLQVSMFAETSESGAGTLLYWYRYKSSNVSTRTAYVALNYEKCLRAVLVDLFCNIVSLYC